MSEEVQKYGVDSKIIESLVLKGDISQMNAKQKVEYYNWLCNSLGLNPSTQPFQIIKFQGKETLYAKKDATDQLRKIYKVSVTSRDVDDTFKEQGLYAIIVKVQDANGRTDIGTGAVNIKNLSGDNLANAIMKAETKAKRRGTLSICGLGMLDESELDTMPEHETKPVEVVESNKEALENYKIQLKEFEDLEEYKLKGRELIDEAISNDVLTEDAEGLAREKLKELKNATISS